MIKSEGQLGADNLDQHNYLHLMKTVLKKNQTKQVSVLLKEPLASILYDMNQINSL